ncbi:MAG: hypothetical protein OES79_10115 [Planctomycetota bacterium]|nr:hypothetical protein [Planctomycetota bacterium]
MSNPHQGLLAIVCILLAAVGYDCRIASAQPPPAATPGVADETEQVSDGEGDPVPDASRLAPIKAPQRPPARRYLPPPARGVLPSGNDRGPSAPVAPQVILEDFDLTPEVLDQAVEEIFSGTDEGSSEVLVRLLYRFDRINSVNIQHWAQAQDNLDGLVKQPQDHALQAFNIQGRVLMVQKKEVAAAYADRFEMQHFYRCDALVGTPEVPAVIYALRVPPSWEFGAALDETISFNGLFIRRGAGPVEVAPLVFMTRRVAWHANTTLGDLGMDVGLLDGLLQNRPLQAKEQECFFRLLATVKVAGAAELLRRAYNDVVFHARELVKEKQALQQRQQELTGSLGQGTTTEQAKVAAEIEALDRQQRLLQLRIDHAKKYRAHEFFPLLRQPQDHVGELKMYRGAAHRIVPVLIHNREMIKRFGIRKYYQIDMMVKLEGKLKVLKGQPKEAAVGAEAEEVDRVTWSHPATVCVLELPEGLPTGDNVNEDLRVAGFFLKHWAYESEQLVDGQPKWRYAPLFIGRRPIWERPPAADSNLIAGAIAGSLFVVALMGVWIGVLYMNRSDRKFQQAVISKVQASEDSDDQVSLNNLGLETFDAADFRHLEQSNTGDNPAGGD